MTMSHVVRFTVQGATKQALEDAAQRVLRAYTGLDETAGRIACRIDSGPLSMSHGFEEPTLYQADVAAEVSW